jgi:hypothetical protein
VRVAALAVRAIECSRQQEQNDSTTNTGLHLQLAPLLGGRNPISCAREVNAVPEHCLTRLLLPCAEAQDTFSVCAICRERELHVPVI